MKTLVECVPNFSEGRDAACVNSIVQAMLALPQVYLLDQEMDADHHRSVITLVGDRANIGEAALRGMERAAQLIDLTRHQGAHPRLGATDVVPFIPIEGVTLQDCVEIAQWVAQQAWERLGIPTYLYEAAARTPERRNLENIRRGQFEGLREEVRTNPARHPDFGRNELHPTAGATVVGARKFLIAYNINLGTPDVSVAKTIARKIRASSGGYACVKAMGVELKDRGLAQVSMNLTDFETTSMETVYGAVSTEAAAVGVRVVESEIVGLVPRRALESAAVERLGVAGFRAGMILENRLAQALEAQGNAPASPPALLDQLAAPFIEAVAAPTATPGGGSVAAHAGALAAALGEMVCGLTLRRKSLASHHPIASEVLERLHRLRLELTSAIDRDAASYDGVMAAFKLPKASDSEQQTRNQAIEKTSKAAAMVPLRTAEMIRDVMLALEGMEGKTLPQAASDMAVAKAMANAGMAGALENVRANLPSIADHAWVRQMEARLAVLTGEQQPPAPAAKVQSQ
jgi:glutamate formiminotransferase/formiminotetrahydrofolate cyclodeaminase